MVNNLVDVALILILYDYVNDFRLYYDYINCGWIWNVEVKFYSLSNTL